MKRNPLDYAIAHRERVMEVRNEADRKRREDANYFMIHPKLWSRADQIDANVEGWGIVIKDEPGQARIRALTREQGYAVDNAWLTPPFQSDLQAAEYVVERQHQGSEFHKRAMIALMKCQIHGAGKADEDGEPARR